MEKQVLLNLVRVSTVNILDGSWITALTAGLSPPRLIHLISLSTTFRISLMWASGLFCLSQISVTIPVLRANIPTNAGANHKYVCIQFGQLGGRRGFNNFVFIYLGIPTVRGRSGQPDVKTLRNVHFIYLLDFQLRSSGYWLRVLGVGLGL